MYAATTLGDMLGDEVREYFASIGIFVTVAIVLVVFFTHLVTYSLAPEPGDPVYPLYGFVISITNSVLQLATPGVAGAAVVVIGLIVWDQHSGF